MLEDASSFSPSVESGPALEAPANPEVALPEQRAEMNISQAEAATEIFESIRGSGDMSESAATEAGGIEDQMKDTTTEIRDLEEELKDAPEDEAQIPEVKAVEEGAGQTVEAKVEAKEAPRTFEGSVGKLRQLYDGISAASKDPVALKTFRREVIKFAAGVHPDQQTDPRLRSLSPLANQLLDFFKNPAAMEGSNKANFEEALGIFESSLKTKEAVAKSEDEPKAAPIEKTDVGVKQTEAAQPVNTEAPVKEATGAVAEKSPETSLQEEDVKATTGQEETPVDTDEQGAEEREEDGVEEGEASEEDDEEEAEGSVQGGGAEAGRGKEAQEANKLIEAGDKLVEETEEALASLKQDFRNEAARGKIGELSGRFPVVQQAMFERLKKNPLDLGMLMIAMHLMMVNSSFINLEIITGDKSKDEKSVEMVSQATNNYKELRRGKGN